jgi:hypothetical protein
MKICDVYILKKNQKEKIFSYQRKLIKGDK